MKRFDALEYKRLVQERIQSELEPLSNAERIEYFRQSAETGPMAAWWRRIRGTQARHQQGEGSTCRRESTPDAMPVE